eukprot:m.123911 g.123911  ORF g.123911 m.123911 type:complete len:2859 (-) comp13763_c1_seq1:490-9066(-)
MATSQSLLAGDIALSLSSTDFSLAGSASGLSSNLNTSSTVCTSATMTTVLHQPTALSQTSLLAKSNTGATVTTVPKASITSQATSSQPNALLLHTKTSSSLNTTVLPAASTQPSLSSPTILTTAGGLMTSLPSSSPSITAPQDISHAMGSAAASLSTALPSPDIKLSVSTASTSLSTGLTLPTVSPSTSLSAASTGSHELDSGLLATQMAPTGLSTTLNTSSMLSSTSLPKPDKQGSSHEEKVEQQEARAEYDFDFPPMELELAASPMQQLQIATPMPQGHSIEHFRDVAALKEQLVNAVSASLIGGPDFYDRQDPTRSAIKTLADAIMASDPEFVLKLALYTRQHLNIRATANFLLAVAANHPSARSFLRLYLGDAVRLPSDWMELAQLSVSLYDGHISFGGLPAALRKAMAHKFADFDEYQLAKYNKPKKQQSGVQPAAIVARQLSHKTDDGDDLDIEKMTFTLKQLIRKLHITQPAYHVMSILGKRYPADPDQFRASGLDGQFNPDLAGKRMRLKVPMTWETQVSAEGNVAKVWQKLIDQRKLPFMAMLRNLKNLIVANISDDHHKQILQKLQDGGTIATSRQFPFRFFSAFQVLEQILQQAEEAPEGEADEAASRHLEPRQQQQQQQRGRKGGRHNAMAATKARVTQLSKKQRSFITKYQAALNQSVALATQYNVSPIKGTTILFIDVSESMHQPCTAARGLGKPKTLLEVAVLLGLMCRRACENCELVLFAQQRQPRVVPPLSGNILDDTANVCLWAKQSTSADWGDMDGTFATDLLEEWVPGPEDSELTTTLFRLCSRALPSVAFPIDLMDQVIHARLQMDNLLVFSNNSDRPSGLTESLLMFRQWVNPELLFVQVNLASRKTAVVNESSSASGEDTPVNPNLDISLAGFSDALLRFVAERAEGSGLLTFIDQIDRQRGLRQKLQASNHMNPFSGSKKKVFSFNPRARKTAVSAKSKLSKASRLSKATSKGRGANLNALHFRFQTLQPTASDKVDSEEGDSDGDFEVAAAPAGLLPLPPSMSRYPGEWKTVRIFVSSTFRDMHGERDVLTRYIMPELKQRMHHLKVHLFEVDLRWGITEMALQHASATATCIREVTNSHLFVGFLGERYGYAPSPSAGYDVPLDPEYDWVREYPTGRSITELEIQAGVLSNPEPATARAFFCLRNSSFSNSVPQPFRKDFAAESPEAAQLLSQLRARVTSSGTPTLQYDAKWCVQDQPDTIQAALIKAKSATQQQQSHTSGATLTAFPVASGLSTLGGWLFSQLWTTLDAQYGSGATDETAANTDADGLELDATEADDTILLENAPDFDQDEPSASVSQEQASSSPTNSTSDGRDNVFDPQKVTDCHQRAALLLDDTFVGRDKDVKAAIEFVHSALERHPRSQRTLCLVTSAVGMGKSAFAARVASASAQLCNSWTHVFPVFIGSASTQDQITTWSELLQQLTASLCERYNLDTLAKAQASATTDIASATSVRNTFHSALTAAVEKLPTSACMVIVIDGLDKLAMGMSKTSAGASSQAGSALFEWLQFPLPPGVAVVATAAKGRLERTLLAQAIKAKISVHGLSLKAMSQADKASVVRTTLQRYRRALDESSFNNQMSILISKRDAGSPIFLGVACQELRLDASFDNLNEKLQALASTLPELFAQVLGRLERQFGVALVELACQVLLCSRVQGGVRQLELALLLEQELGVSALKSQGFVLSLKPFLTVEIPTSVALQGGSEQMHRLKLVHPQLIDVCQRRYLPRGTTSPAARAMYTTLSAFYNTLADPHGDKSYSDADADGLRLLPTYLLAAGDTTKFKSTICTLPFVEAVAHAQLLRDMIPLYNASGVVLELVSPVLVKRLRADPLLSAYRTFAKRHVATLLATPAMAFQLVINDAYDEQTPSVLTSSALDTLSTWLKKGTATCNPVALPNKPLELLQRVPWVANASGDEDDARAEIQTVSRPHSLALDTSIPDLPSKPTSVALSPSGRLLAFGSKAGAVTVVEREGGTTVCVFEGHGGEVCRLAFATEFDLFSGSFDETLCRWNIQSESLVSRFQANQQRVTDFAVDGENARLVSVGWDQLIKVFSFSGSSTKPTSTLRLADSPINAVALHADGNTAVFGCWSGLIGVADLVRRRSIAAMYVPNSVQGVCFSPCGNYVVSVDLVGRIYMHNTFGALLLNFLSQPSPLNTSARTLQRTGHTIHVGYTDGTLRSFDMSRGRFVPSLSTHNELTSEPDAVTAVGVLHATAPASESTTVELSQVTGRVLGHHSGRVLVIHNGHQLELKSHSKHINAISTYSNRAFVVASDDETATVIRDVDAWRTGGQQPQALKHPRAVRAVLMLTPELVITGCDNGAVTAWKYNGRVGAFDMIAELFHHEDAITGLCEVKSTNKGRTRAVVACSSRDSSVSLCAVNASVGEMELLSRLHDVHMGWINGIASLPRSAMLFTAGNDGKVRCIMTNGGQPMQILDDVLEGHDAPVMSITCSELRLVTTGRDGTARIHHIQSEHYTGSADQVRGGIIYAPTPVVHAAALVGNHVLLGCDTNLLAAFDLNSMTMQHITQAHTGAVTSICALDASLVSSGFDNAITTHATVPTTLGIAGGMSNAIESVLESQQSVTRAAVEEQASEAEEPLKRRPGRHFHHPDNGMVLHVAPSGCAVVYRTTDPASEMFSANLQPSEILGAHHPVTACCMNVAGSCIAMATHNTVVLADFDGRRVSLPVPGCKLGGDWVSTVAWNQRGVLVGTTSGALIMWEASLADALTRPLAIPRLKPPVKLQTAHKSHISATVADGAAGFVTACQQGRVVVWRHNLDADTKRTDVLVPRASTVVIQEDLTGLTASSTCLAVPPQEMGGVTTQGIRFNRVGIDSLKV